MRQKIVALLASGACAGTLLVGPGAIAVSASPTPTSASPSATWRDCESYARRARTGCLGQTVQPWQSCPSALVGWFTLTKSTSALVRCKKSGASTKWVWA